MREWCACGAAIRGRRSDVLHWRNNHNHPGPTPDDEPERNGAHAQVEPARPRYFEAWTPTHSSPVTDARVGFRMGRD